VGAHSGGLSQGGRWECVKSQDRHVQLPDPFILLTPTGRHHTTAAESRTPHAAVVHLLSKAETRDMLLPRLISGKLPVENLALQFPPGMAEELAAGA